MKLKLQALCAVVALCSGAPAVLAQAVTDPQTFATTAASSNMFEIQSSELALKQPVRSDVKAFAEQMIKDHTAAGEKMKAAAQKDGVAVPTEMAAKEQTQLKQLQAASGDAFEAAYVTVQTGAHEDAVALFQSFSENGKQSALRTFATATLPTLEMHLAEAKKLAK